MIVTTSNKKQADLLFPLDGPLKSILIISLQVSHKTENPAKRD